MRSSFALPLLVPVALVGACSDAASGSQSDRSDGAPVTTRDGGADTGAWTPGDASSGDASRSEMRPDAVVMLPPCESTPGEDRDGDGFAAPSDCNDCVASVNPGALDIPGNGLDEDCSGKADDEPLDCERGLSTSSKSALDAARALGLCRDRSGDSWGLIEARWVFPDGTLQSRDYFQCAGGKPPHPLSRAILSQFGDHNLPTAGTRMVALSSGLAEPGVRTLGASDLPAEGTSPYSVSTCNASPPPLGFPAAPAECAPPFPKELVNDGIALELAIRAPTNATALRFDFFFLTTEFPRYVCSGRNDQFVALLDSQHPAIPPNQNISLDRNGNVISVDTAFMEVCTPVTYLDRTFTCPRGAGKLAGTGVQQRTELSGTFIEGAATDWLKTVSPIVPGEIFRIRFAIWDTEDTQLDSTVLLDHFHWDLIEPTVVPSEPEIEEPETDWVIY